MAGATARIVVQATPVEKKQLAAKARKLGMPVAELMRAGAKAFREPGHDSELNALADAAKHAAEQAARSIDEAIVFVAQSNKRIAAMEAASRRRKAT
jgi:hypothetical protein